MEKTPKRPTTASLKKVTAENLAALGGERLAALLVTFAETRPELKRRLRMELAAEQGAEHLVLEVDKRLVSLDASRTKVSWRKRASFVGDLDVLRTLIVGKLALLDPVMALDRMWRFMDLTRRLGTRVKDRDGALGAVFLRAAEDIGALLADRGDAAPAAALAEAVAGNPGGWTDWLPAVLEKASPAVARAALAQLQLRHGAQADLGGPLRLLADAADDIVAYRSTFSDAALRSPAISAQLAQRLLAAGRVDEAGEALAAARAAPRAELGRLMGRSGDAEPDFDWETVWIAYLEHAGQQAAAQDARWASFERTLSVDRAREFVRRLTGFDDVEAEMRAREHAAAHSDFARGLRFLMSWPALPEAAAMIAARAEEIALPAEDAELWAGRLRARHPLAAHTLLRRTAAAAFRRRDFATCDRLTLEADTITLD